MFEKLKSLFVVNDEEFKKKIGGGKTETPVSKQSQPVEDDSISAQQDFQLSDTGEGQVTDKFTNILFGAIEKANKDGFDYLEFRNSLNSLKKMDMDESTRFKSAFAMAQTMKATPQKLISSAEHYLGILANEEKKFDHALKSQKERQIGDKQKKLQSINKAVREKAEKIKRLSEEIEKHQQELKTIEGDLQQTSGKMNSTKMNFIASYKSIVSQIQEDVDKMKQYLK